MGSLGLKRAVGVGTIEEVHQRRQTGAECTFLRVVHATRASGMLFQGYAIGVSRSISAGVAGKTEGCRVLLVSFRGGTDGAMFLRLFLVKVNIFGGDGAVCYDSAQCQSFLCESLSGFFSPEHITVGRQGYF